MQLKTYQQTALDQLDRWIDALKEARLNSEKAINVLKNRNRIRHPQVYGAEGIDRHGDCVLRFAV